LLRHLHRIRFSLSATRRSSGLAVPRTLNIYRVQTVSPACTRADCARCASTHIRSNRVVVEVRTSADGKFQVQILVYRLFHMM